MMGLTKHVGVAFLAVMATLVLAAVTTVSPAVKLSADSTALIMGGTGLPTPNDYYVEVVRNQYIEPIIRARSSTTKR